MESHGRHSSNAAHHYQRLLVMVVLHFAAMYALMYAMVARYADVFMSLNQVYMAGLMTASMLVIEVPLMWNMYPVKRANAALVAVGVAGLLGCWFGIREQSAIGDEQFLRSMISHHSGAILMCKEAALRDDDVERLCDQIVASQKAEISEMKAMLDGRVVTARR